MAPVLSSKDHDAIYDTVRKSFGDFPLFDTLVSEKLRLFLSESNGLEINEKFTKNVFKRYFAAEAFKSPEQKALVYPLELIFQTTCVLLTTYRSDLQHLFWEDKKMFLDHYPQFSKGIDANELEFLMQFRNMMKIALTIIPARLNKGRLLQISGKLEGSHSDYITGSGQRVEVDRRVEIYQQEGKQKAVFKKSRGKRGHIAVSDSEGEDEAIYRLDRKKRRTRTIPATPRKAYTKKTRRQDGVLTCTSSSFSNSKLKQMIMAEEQVKFLLQIPSVTTASLTPTTVKKSVSVASLSAAVKPIVSPSYALTPANTPVEPTRKSARKRKPLATTPSVSEVSSEASTSSRSRSSSESTAPDRPVLPARRNNFRAPRPPPRLSDSSLSSNNGTGSAAASAGWKGGRRGRPSAKLAEKLFPRSRTGAPLLASAVSQDTDTTQWSDSTHHSPTFSNGQQQHQYNNNMTIWHMNMNDTLCGFEDLLNLTGHANDKMLDELLPSAVGDDSLMTIFSLLTNKSDTANHGEGVAGAGVADTSHGTLMKANSLGLSTDDPDTWGCCDLDDLVPHSLEHSPRLDDSRGSGGGGEGFHWEDDSVILIPSGPIPTLPCMTRSSSGVFNDKDADELLQLL